MNPAPPSLSRRPGGTAHGRSRPRSENERGASNAPTHAACRCRRPVRARHPILAGAAAAFPEPPGGDHRPLLRRSEEHTSELQSRQYLVCRLLLEKKKKKTKYASTNYF